MKPINNKQQGAALIILLTALILTLSSVVLSGFDKNSLAISRAQNSIQALSDAKQALINFALLSDNIAGSIGYLPCPDLNGDGLSDEPCGNLGESVEGWLPWQTLGTKALRDSSHVCLRYVVSGRYKISPALALDSTLPTPGHFVIHDENNTVRVGTTQADYALAVVFSPHKTVAGQSRSAGAGAATACGSDTLAAAINQADNYLENFNNVNNATGVYAGPGAPGDAALPTAIASVFILAGERANFNDVITWVSPADFADVYARMP